MNNLSFYIVILDQTAFITRHVLPFWTSCPSHNILTLPGTHIWPLCDSDYVLRSAGLIKWSACTINYCTAMDT